MATDYDAPRTATLEPETESLDLLRERRVSPAGDLDGAGEEYEYELPGFDIVDEDLTGLVIPVRNDEFRCSACFLVLHHSLHAGRRTSGDVCRDCA